MSEFNTSSKQTDDIPFTEPQDLTECNCDPLRGYDHVHTACCGAKAYTQDGGVQDGFVKCKGGCGDYICVAHVLPVVGGPFCLDCLDKKIDDAQEADSQESAAQAPAPLKRCFEELARDARQYRERMLRETDTTELADLYPSILELALQVSLIQAQHVKKLEAHDAIPFIFGGAV